jgi:hypothetical protein
VTARRLRRRRREGGQGIVEFAIVVPVFLIILLGILEFGFIFDQTMTLSYGTREGARSGAAFAKGNNTTMICNSTVDVDKHIIAAVQRVLQAPGSDVDMANVSRIRIYRANATGGDSGSGNDWAPGSGPVVDGQALLFQPSGPAGYDACSRVNAWIGNTPPQSIGVAITYRYDYKTPLAGIFRFFGGDGAGSLPITDKTIMALNPTDQQ